MLAGCQLVNGSLPSCVAGLSTTREQQIKILRQAIKRRPGDRGVESHQQHEKPLSRFC